MVSRGPWQASIERSLRAGLEIRNPVSDLRGNARNYQGRYQRSFSALLERLGRDGHTIVRTPGPRGGEWSATYRMVS